MSAASCHRLLRANVDHLIVDGRSIELDEKPGIFGTRHHALDVLAGHGSYGIHGFPPVVLAAAYGVVEEGLATQSLFNPDYAHQHLLRC
ncbi:MAG: hypothetical protein WAN44_15155 [Propionibacteriaceae bacterium]